ncbi:hypothetical protein X943_000242 [Babesia divergens]|uniref:Vacuolar protein sorting-associated protein 8 central domain-containing protein n=1 Tax=Babesia divergens TaxID=32595 RepID=A0AAD9GA62_BABDI|nr:hypothetical protein X943_000242 [Babesia divergens]
MSYKSLEELLVVDDLSDDSDVDPSDASCSNLTDNTLCTPDYNDLINAILHDKDLDSESESAIESVSPSFVKRRNTIASSEDEGNQKCQDSEDDSPRLLGALFGRLPSHETERVSQSDTHVNINDSKYSNDKPTLAPSHIATEIAGHGSNALLATTDSPQRSAGCRCHITCHGAISRLMETCGPVFPTLSTVVRQQLMTPANLHKVSYICSRNPAESDGEHASVGPYTSSEPDGTLDEFGRLESCKHCLNDLGIPYKTLKLPGKSSILLRRRHNVSDALERLGLFKDGLLTVDHKTLTSIGASSADTVPLSCMATNNQLLVAGTSTGSILIGDIYNHNNERQFAPNGEPTQHKDASSGQLDWQEIDKQGDTSVTYVDVQCESNWICGGYGNGMVKLMHSKSVVHRKTLESQKTDAVETTSAADRVGHSRGFGLMADAVSSALGGFKKSGSHVLCSAKVFSEAVKLCKFTIVDSHEEILCASKNSIALLSYSKTVMSHNLHVNPLQSFNTNVLENDDIVDIACLSSNPQYKYITGMSLGGWVAIATTTKCVVISTQPELSILFRVPFNDYSKKLGDGTLAIFPSITWMVLNNSGDIKPLLLIMLGNRLSFTLCDAHVGKRSGSSVVCTNVAYMKFGTMIRNIRIVSRDMFVAIDVENMLHVVQVNIFNSVMYYDIVRSFDLGFEFVADSLWPGMDNISSAISVQTRTIKMVANSYKKFSGLVSELFQGKRNESFFELRLASLYVLTTKGIWSSEIHSWIKAIGDLTAIKKFSESLAICQALEQGLVPGLLDYKAYIEYIQKVIVYVLHQSSAHIIRLYKLIDSSSINLFDDNDEEWPDNVRDDITSQIESLCCSMFDVCICMDMYDCLNDLIHRCFATLKIDHMFVKYVLLNYFKGRLDLAQLKPDIFETIFDVYDKVLDYIHNTFLCNTDGIEDCIVFLRGQVELQQNALCTMPVSNRACDFDEHIVVYEILCNHLSNLYAFCSKNDIPFSKERAVCRLSKHSQWHCFVYCPELIGSDISLALDILCSEALNKIESSRSSLTPSSDLGLGALWNNTEDRFVIRVLYSILNSCLTFENYGLAPEDNVSNFCKVLGYITFSGTFKPSFPMASDLRYARPELEYDDDVIDFENLDRLSFLTTYVVNSSPCILQMLMATSPRLLFTCLANLFLKCDSVFEEQHDILGSKIDVFNFLLNVLIGCLTRLEESQSTFGIRQILSMFVLGVSVYSDSFYLDMRTQAVAMYVLVTEIGDIDYDPFVNPVPLPTKELMLADGSFNDSYYFNTFCKKSDDLFENIRQFNISRTTTCALLRTYIRKTLFTIYRKFDCQSSWTRNAHFTNIKRLCSGLAPFVHDFETRFLLCEVIGDYENVICTYESVGSHKVFPYLQQCLQYIKSGPSPPDHKVSQLLLLDPLLQKEFVMVLMKNLPRLISVNLKSSTDLLVEIFSMPNIANVFNDKALQFSQDMLLRTLKDFPELQLVVLGALLDMESGNIPTEEYFNQYLRLLSRHDKKSICQFFKRQKTLNISSCLEICMSAGIHDAVAYLLMRAGDFEGAAHWIIKAFQSATSDLEMCKRLVSDARDMCVTFSEFMAYDTFESIWFGILRAVVTDMADADADALIEEVFNVGILKFTKLTNALLELEKYDSVRVAMLKKSLEKLLYDLECQTFMVNSSSLMSTTVLNQEFRRSLACNKRGVVVNVSDDAKTACVQCNICMRDLLLTPMLEITDCTTNGQGSADTTSNNSPQKADLGISNLSPFENHLGVIYTLPSLPNKPDGEASIGCPPSVRIANIYQDRLSTFVNKKASSNSNRATWNFATLGIAPQFVPWLESQMQNEMTSLQPINIFWCGHVFHVACTPSRCPTCYSD